MPSNGDKKTVISNFMKSEDVYDILDEIQKKQDKDGKLGLLVDYITTIAGFFPQISILVGSSIIMKLAKSELEPAVTLEDLEDFYEKDVLRQVNRDERRGLDVQFKIAQKWKYIVEDSQGCWIPDGVPHISYYKV